MKIEVFSNPVLEEKRAIFSVRNPHIKYDTSWTDQFDSAIQKAYGIDMIQLLRELIANADDRQKATVTIHEPGTELPMEETRHITIYTQQRQSYTEGKMIVEMVFDLPEIYYVRRLTA